MNFSYVDVIGNECKGWLNLFFGNYPVALVRNVYIANEMRRVIPEKTNQGNSPDNEYEPFGDEWRKEMMKLTKSQLIDFIKRIRCR